MNVGDRVAWRSLNLDYTGTVVDFYRHFAVVRIDGSGRSVLLFDKDRQPQNTKSNE